jgi:hypothetical protein
MNAGSRNLAHSACIGMESQAMTMAAPGVAHLVVRRDPYAVLKG